LGLRKTRVTRLDVVKIQELSLPPGSIASVGESKDRGERRSLLKLERSLARKLRRKIREKKNPIPKGVKADPSISRPPRGGLYI